MALLLAACGEKAATMQDLRSVEVVFPNQTKIMAETVRLEPDLMRGLMFQDSLAHDRGMLFVYKKADYLPFWMYQIKFPLDILWLDKDHRIVEMSEKTPACLSKSARECPHYGAHQKAQFVLEVNAGIAEKNGLKLGDLVDF